MQAVISVWRDRCGLSVIQRSAYGDYSTDGVSGRAVQGRNESLQRPGACGASINNVIALDTALPVRD